MDLGLQGRVVLVTGATGGIGTAITGLLAEEGALIAVGWHNNRERAGGLVDSITRQGGKATGVRIDQRDPDSIRAAVRQVERELGDIAVLVANAVSWPAWEPETPATLTDCFVANVTGTLTTIDSVLPGMRKAGWGRLVVVSSDVDAEAAKTPTGRICTPEDVASAVAYLGSAANGHINGEILSVAGGRHLTR